MSWICSNWSRPVVYVCFLFMLPVLVFVVFNSCCSFSFVVYVPIKLDFSFSLFDISPTSDCRYYNYK